MNFKLKKETFIHENKGLRMFGTKNKGPLNEAFQQKLNEKILGNKYRIYETLKQKSQTENHQITLETGRN